MSKYNHTIQFHNLEAPREIVPILIDLIKPKSVIDIGCGLGTFLRAFKESGINTIQGIDGKWCKKEFLFQNIEPNEFKELELESRINIDSKFDIAVCLEVAEHLTKERAITFTEDLCKLSDVILFSAAIPFQGGDHHHNEQWLAYWTNLFEKQGYEIFDVLKPFFWDNKKVFWWYKQNMVLFVKKTKVPESLKNLPKNTITNPIHEDLYLTITNFREKNAVKRSIRMLYKSVLHKIGIIK